MVNPDTREVSLTEIFTEITIAIYCFALAADRLLSAVCTLRFIKSEVFINEADNVDESAPPPQPPAEKTEKPPPLEKPAPKPKAEEKAEEEEDDDEKTEKPEKAENPPPTSTSTLNAGTLDQLVYRLTADEDTIDKVTFIRTYRSFAGPWELLEKLKQRWQSPDEPDEKVRAVQLRVAVVLKYWLENQLNDFDQYLQGVLEEFLIIMNKDSTFKKVTDDLKKFFSTKMKDRYCLVVDTLFADFSETFQGKKDRRGQQKTPLRPVEQAAA